MQPVQHSRVQYRRICKVRWECYNRTGNYMSANNHLLKGLTGGRKVTDPKNVVTKRFSRHMCTFMIVRSLHSYYEKVLASCRTEEPFWEQRSLKSGRSDAITIGNEIVSERSLQDNRNDDDVEKDAGCTWKNEISFPRNKSQIPSTPSTIRHNLGQYETIFWYQKVEQMRTIRSCSLLNNSYHFHIIAWDCDWWENRESNWLWNTGTFKVHQHIGQRSFQFS